MWGRPLSPAVLGLTCLDFRPGCRGGGKESPGRGFDGAGAPEAMRDLPSKGAHYMARLRTTLSVLGAAVLATTSLAVLNASSASAQVFNYAHLNKIQQRHVSGLLASELDLADPAFKARGAAPLSARRAATSDACTNRFGSNVKVNQNCLNLT